MRHKVAGRNFGRASHLRRAMFRNMVTDLIRHGRITTTLPKAKESRIFAEKMITHGKTGTVHARRQAAAFLTDKDVVARLFDDVAGRYADRQGGYTRLVKLGPRQGDGAEMAVLELVQ